MTATVDIIKTKKMIEQPVVLLSKSDTAAVNVSDDKKEAQKRQEINVFCESGIKLKNCVIKTGIKMIQILKEEWS
jgi:hypothetical protein